MRATRGRANCGWCSATVGQDPPNGSGVRVARGQAHRMGTSRYSAGMTPELAHHIALDARLVEAVGAIRLLEAVSWPVAEQEIFLEGFRRGQARLPQPADQRLQAPATHQLILAPAGRTWAPWGGRGEERGGAEHVPTRIADDAGAALHHIGAGGRG